MTLARKALGARAEEAARAELVRRGFEIIGQNVRVGKLELDVLAARGDLLVVCEVRARTTTRFGSPAETIGPVKIARIRRATSEWLRSQSSRHRQIRFDVASVIERSDGTLELDYFENAF
jgi:putative endonuclease